MATNGKIHLPSSREINVIFSNAHFPHREFAISGPKRGGGKEINWWMFAIRPTDTPPFVFAQCLHFLSDFTIDITIFCKWKIQLKIVVKSRQWIFLLDADTAVLTWQRPRCVYQLMISCLSFEFSEKGKVLRYSDMEIFLQKLSLALWWSNLSE